MQDITSARPRLLGEESEELFLTILASHEGNLYSTQITEAASGSESDGGGQTLGGAVNSALEWAGVADFRVSVHGSAESIRSELRAANDSVDFDFVVRLFTDF